MKSKLGITKAEDFLVGYFLLFIQCSSDNCFSELTFLFTVKYKLYDDDDVNLNHKLLTKTILWVNFMFEVTLISWHK